MASWLHRLQFVRSKIMFSKRMMETPGQILIE